MWTFVFLVAAVIVFFAGGELVWKLVEEIMAKKRKKASKKKLAEQAIVPAPVAVAPAEIWAPLNEVQIVEVLRGQSVILTVGDAKVQVSYQRHPAAAPPGLARFWADVEDVARLNRARIESSPGNVQALERSSMTYAQEEQQNMVEEEAGAAVRSSPAAVAALKSESFIPDFAKKDAAQLKAQHEEQSAKTEEQRRKELTSTAAQPVLEHKEGKKDGDEAK
jgi:hypothetical protein